MSYYTETPDAWLLSAVDETYPHHHWSWGPVHEVDGVERRQLLCDGEVVPVNIVDADMLVAYTAKIVGVPTEVTKENLVSVVRDRIQQWLNDNSERF